MKPYQCKVQMEELFNKHQTIKGVANALEINEKTAARWFKKHEIDTSHSIGSRRVQMNEDYFEVIDTKEKAYWLGFIYADGCIYKGDSPNSYRLQINLKASDKQVLVDFQHAIASDYKIQEKRVRDSEAVLLKVNSTKMCHDLMDKGVLPRKSQGCDFPTAVPQHLIQHFIRGYFDGDGSIYKQKQHAHDKRYRVCIVGAESFLDEMNHRFAQLGIKTNISQAGNSIAYRLDIYSKESLKRLYDFLYTDATVFLPRKHAIFNTFLMLNVPLESDLLDKAQVNCGEEA